MGILGLYQRREIILELVSVKCKQQVPPRSATLNLEYATQRTNDKRGSTRLISAGNYVTAINRLIISTGGGRGGAGSFP